MPLGPGKYDEICTEMRERLHATDIILIVFGGDKGPGFEIQLHPAHVLRIPHVLRELARQIEQSHDRETQN